MRLPSEAGIYEKLGYSRMREAWHEVERTILMPKRHSASGPTSPGCDRTDLALEHRGCSPCEGRAASTGTAAYSARGNRAGRHAAGKLTAAV